MPRNCVEVRSNFCRIFCISAIGFARRASITESKGGRSHNVKAKHRLSHCTIPLVLNRTQDRKHLRPSVFISLKSAVNRLYRIFIQLKYTLLVAANPIQFSSYQFFMRLHIIRSPLAPLNKGGTRFRSKSPFLRGI